MIAYMTAYIAIYDCLYACLYGCLYDCLYGCSICRRRAATIVGWSTTRSCLGAWASTRSPTTQVIAPTTVSLVVALATT